MFGLEGFVSEFGTLALVGAIAALAVGGFVKGVVGFALPMVALSLAGSFLPFDVALALLILPTLVSNTAQALRNGVLAAWGSLGDYWRLNAILVVTIALAAQLVVVLPEWLLFGMLGVSICAFGASQLLGWRATFEPRNKNIVESGVALVSGFFGGLAGVWGPPVVMYLLARDVPKVEMVRVQALCYMLGSVVLFAAHLRSGVLNSMTLPMSAWLVVPTILAVFAGYRIQDRLDQAVFRKVTLIVLMLAGLNLLRRAIFV